MGMCDCMLYSPSSSGERKQALIASAVVPSENVKSNNNCRRKTIRSKNRCNRSFKNRRRKECYCTNSPIPSRINFKKQPCTTKNTKICLFPDLLSDTNNNEQPEVAENIPIYNNATLRKARELLDYEPTTCFLRKIKEEASKIILPDPKESPTKVSSNFTDQRQAYEDYSAISRCQKSRKENKEINACSTNADASCMAIETKSLGVLTDECCKKCCKCSQNPQEVDTQTDKCIFSENEDDKLIEKTPAQEKNEIEKLPPSPTQKITVKKEKPKAPPKSLSPPKSPKKEYKPTGKNPKKSKTPPKKNYPTRCSGAIVVPDYIPKKTQLTSPKQPDCSNTEINQNIASCVCPENFCGPCINLNDGSLCYIPCCSQVNADNYFQSMAKIYHLQQKYPHTFLKDRGDEFLTTTSNTVKRELEDHLLLKPKSWEKFPKHGDAHKCFGIHCNLNNKSSSFNKENCHCSYCCKRCEKSSLEYFNERNKVDDFRRKSSSFLGGKDKDEEKVKNAAKPRNKFFQRNKLESKDSRNIIFRQSKNKLISKSRETRPKTMDSCLKNSTSFSRPFIFNNNNDSQILQCKKSELGRKPTDINNFISYFNSSRAENNVKGVQLFRNDFFFDTHSVDCPTNTPRTECIQKNTDEMIQTYPSSCSSCNKGLMTCHCHLLGSKNAMNCTICNKGLMTCHCHLAGNKHPMSCSKFNKGLMAFQSYDTSGNKTMWDEIEAYRKSKLSSLSVAITSPIHIEPERVPTPGRSQKVMVKMPPQCNDKSYLAKVKYQRPMPVNSLALRFQKGVWR